MKPRIWKNYYDVVILPPKNVRDHAITLSKKLEKYGTTWSLGEKYFIPHISLYHIPVPPSRFNDFIDELKRIVSGYAPRTLALTRITQLEQYHAILAMTENPAWLKELYRTIIKCTHTYFDMKYGVNELWGKKHLPRTMQKNIEAYGTPMVGRYFLPHITLGVLQGNGSSGEEIEKMKLKPLRFNVDAIAVCELGRSFSCQRIVRKIFF